MRRTLVIAGLINICASSQISALGVAAARLPGLLNLPEQSAVWFPGAFMLGTLCLTPLAGLLVRQLGPRRLIVLCLVGSFLINLALSFTSQLIWLVLGTFGLGAAVAPLTPASKALIDQAIPPDSDLQGVATTVWCSGSTAGALWGALGGAIALNHWGWTGLSFSRSPVGLVALILLALLPAAASGTGAPHPRTDWLGMLSLPLALGATGFVLHAGPVLGWFGSPTVMAATSLALVAGLAFAVGARRPQAAAVLDLGLLSSRALRQALLLSLGVAAFSTGQLETLYLGSVEHLSPQHLGWRGAVGGVCMLLGSALGGWLASRFGARRGTALALLILCAGKSGFLFYQPGISLWAAIWPAALSSLGYGSASTTLSFLAFSDPRCSREAGAAAMLLLAAQLGGAFGLPLMEELFHCSAGDAVAAYQHVFRLELAVTLGLTLWIAAQALIIRDSVEKS